MYRTDLLLRAQHLREQRTPFVLATVVRAQRPTSAKPGDSALVLPDGTIEGFVGGTCAASTVRLEGLRLIGTGRSTLLRITPEPASTEPTSTEPTSTGSDGTDEGHRIDESEGLITVANPCLSGGTLDIFLEAVVPPALVYVFGEAPVARALAEVGAAVGYQMVASTDPAAPIPPDAAAVVIASHGRDEHRVLRAALETDTSYLALVASRRRAAGVLDELDLTGTQRQRVHSPAGLDIGAASPAEIAVSILAEMISKRPRPTADGSGLIRSAVRLTARQPSVAVDPVCGMQVAVVADAITYEHAGQTWYFCGTGCRSAFADAPDRYLG